MKINSINNIKPNYNKQSFKRTAVPYPEYNKAYTYDSKTENVINSLVNKISELFHPSVTKEAIDIKQKIDSIYDPQVKSPKTQLLSVLA